MNDFDKNSDNFKMMMEFWNIWKRFAEYDGTDSYWKDLSKKIDDFVTKSKNREFASDLGYALLMHFERVNNYKGV